MLFSPDSVIVSVPRHCLQIKIIKSLTESLASEYTSLEYLLFYIPMQADLHNLHSLSQDDAGENG